MIKTRIQKMPEPTSKKVCIVANGMSRATRHDYFETRPMTDGGFEFMFRCFQTGAIRRFGTWYPDNGPEPEDDADDAGVEAIATPDALALPLDADVGPGVN